jgi:hypothetical protein
MPSIVGFMSGTLAIEVFLSFNFCPVKVTYRVTGVFQSPESQFKNRPNPRRWLAETYRGWSISGRWVTKNGQIPEDDLPRMAKSQKMTYREWPNPGRWNTKNGQIPEDDLLRLAKSRRTTSRNLKRGFYETSSLKPSSGNDQFQLVVSRNWLSGDWKTPVSPFDWIKPSQKSFSRTK